MGRMQFIPMYEKFKHYYEDIKGKQIEDYIVVPFFIHDTNQYYFLEVGTDSVDTPHLIQLWRFDDSNPDNEKGVQYMWEHLYPNEEIASISITSDCKFVVELYEAYDKDKKTIRYDVFEIKPDDLAIVKEVEYFQFEGSTDEEIKQYKKKIQSVYGGDLLYVADSIYAGNENYLYNTYDIVFKHGYDSFYKIDVVPTFLLNMEFRTLENVITKFELENNILTVETESDGTIICPVAEDCRWEAWAVGGERMEFIDTRTYEDLKNQIINTREWYLKTGIYESPLNVCIEIVDGVIVRIYTIVH